MPSRGSRLAFAGLLGATLVIAGPASAVPVEVPLGDAGSQGFALPAAFSGMLGATGLRVRALPTMWLITGLQPGGPASLAGVPDPRTGRLRIAAIDARPVEDLTLEAVLAACRPERDRLVLTLARKRPGTEESYLGPFELPLASASAAARRAEVARLRTRLLPDVLDGKSPERLLLDAQQARAAGDLERARKALAAVPAGEERELAGPLVGELKEARAAEALRLAEAAAAAGRYEQARQLLRGVEPVGTWAGVRRTRDAEWRAALASRAAWAADKRRLEAARKAAEEARRAEEEKATSQRRRLKL